MIFFSLLGQTIFPSIDSNGEIEGYWSYPLPLDGHVLENYDYSQPVPRTAEEFEAEALAGKTV